MNELEKIKNPLAFEKRKNLNKGQKNLFCIVSEKILTNSSMTFEEAKKIYISDVCQCVKDGVPHYWESCYHYDDVKKEWVGKLVPMNEYFLKRNVLIWVCHALGALVLKGYLKVLPILELE